MNAAAADRTRLPILVTLFVLTMIVPIELKIGTLLMSPLRIVMLIALVPLGVGLYTGRYGKVLLVDWLFLGHVLWAMISLTVNNPTRAFEATGAMAMEFLGAYLIARTQIRDKGTFTAFIILLVTAIAITLPFALAESLTGNRVMINMFGAIGLPTINPVAVEYRMGLARVQGPLDHPIHYGLFGSLVVTLAFIGLKERMSFVGRSIAASIAMGAVFLSLSSGAILAVTLQAMLLGWSLVAGFVRRKWFWLFIVGVLAYVAVDLASNRTPLQVFMSKMTFSPHNAYYRKAANTAAWQNIMNNPFFGIGMARWQRPGWMVSGSIDNFWLVVGIRHGLIGLALLVAGYLHGIVRIGLARLTDPGDILIRRAWMITFSGLMFTLTTVHVWAIAYSYVFFFFGSALWLVTAPSLATAEEPAPGPARELRYSRFDRRSAKASGPAGGVTAATADSGAQPGDAPADPAPRQGPGHRRPAQAPLRTRFGKTGQQGGA